MKKYTITAVGAIMAMASAIPMGAAAQTFTPGPVFSALVGVATINVTNHYAPGVTAAQIANDQAFPAHVSRIGYVNGKRVNDCNGTFAQCHVNPAYNIAMRDLACGSSISIKSISRSAPSGATVTLTQNSAFVMSNGTVVMSFTNSTTLACP